MTAEKLKRVIESGMYDVEFDYQGKHGSVCFFGSDDISLCYNDEKEKSFQSVDDAMKDTEVFGKPLTEIAEELEMYFDYD